MAKTMRGRERWWLFGEDDGDKMRRKRKPHGEWLFGEEHENNMKKKEITWKNGKGNRKIIEKKKNETDKNN